MKTQRRTQPIRGLTYPDVNKGRIITIQDDVLGIKRRIQDLWPELRVYFDQDSDEWVITEMCRDHTERLVFTTTALNESVIARLYRAQAGDFTADLDKEEAQREKDHDAKLADMAGDAGERLAHAFAKDGLTVRARISTMMRNR